MRHATVRNLALAGLTVASLAALSGLAAQAEPQTPAATETTSEPSLRPDTALPAYPTQSRRNKEAGVVRIKLCVEADGRVSKADLAETSGFPNLDNAVLNWAKGVKFNPAVKGATPVAVCDFPIKYEFQVTKGPTTQQQTNNAFDIGPASHP